MNSKADRTRPEDDALFDTESVLTFGTMMFVNGCVAMASLGLLAFGYLT